MKELLLLLLIPIYLIIVILKNIFDIVEPLARSIGDVFNDLIDGNRTFWKNILK